MAALGRLLTTIGWLWFIAGFVGPILDIGQISPFPGLILVFIGRIVRGQARRRETGTEVEGDETSPAPRPLNTERPKPLPMRAEQGGVVVAPSPVPVEVEPPVVAETVFAEDDPSPEKLYTGIFVGSAEVAGSGSVSIPDEHEVGSKETLSSAEMIARARRRWDRRP